MKNIEEVYCKEYTFIDVRSPKEFEEDHIPGAINIPLFDNEERAVVGTLYKQTSREAAVEKGIEIFGKKLPEMIKKYNMQKGPFCVYCWRGGMRSRAIVSFLKSLNYDVIQLGGGYKQYRRFVRESLERFPIPPLVVVYGLTGSGKTELLNQIENSVDLEGLAEHRGSIFGDTNKSPNHQKMFESLLLKRLIELKDQPFLFTEGESRRIGRIVITESFWKAMQKGSNVRLECPFEKRLERSFKEYASGITEIKIKCIEKHLGKKKTEELLALLKENKIKDIVKILLLEYYDKLYAHTVERKEYIATVHSLEELKAIKPLQES
jgi:tRNA 2-selenouridine synthase